MTEQIEYQYDVFISYTEADREWVEGYLLDALEQAGMKQHSEEAFELGEPRLVAFEKAVKHSKRVLLVLSPDYLGDSFNQFADLLAQSYGLETATWPVIPLTLKPVEPPPRIKMLKGLDATNPEDWPGVLERLCEALQRPVPGPAPKPPCPYPGMVPFRAKDARFFYGREDEIGKMLQHLRHQRFLFVIGPSGSGKSSLVSAGLLMKLTQSSYFPQNFWRVKEIRPGSQPLQMLIHILEGDPEQPVHTIDRLLEGPPPAQRLLLVIDQFEELFTQTKRGEQQDFIKIIHNLRKVDTCALILVMRADFYPDLMNSPLWPIDASQRLEIAPLRGKALREAIERPAADVGVYLESELVNLLLMHAADEPGILPLLQETMVLLWDKMQRRLIPLSAYQQFESEGHSGLAVAMETKANATLNDLSTDQQAIARRIFLRLIQFGEGRADTRRQQPMEALRSAGEDPHVFDETLRRLTDSRLLTLSGGEKDLNQEGEKPEKKVDIAHESLINGWPRLQEWLSQRRKAEQTRRRLEAKAEEWVRLGRENGGLLDEAELPEAERWLKSQDAKDLGYNEDLSALVQTSREVIEEAEREKEAARQRELAATRKLAEGHQKLAKEAEARRKAEEKARHEAEQRTEEQKKAAESARALLAKNYWSSAVNTGKNNNWLESVHFFARAASIESNPSQIRNTILNTQHATKDLFLEKLWSTVNNASVEQPMKHKGPIWGAAFSRSGHLILTWDGVGTTLLWHTLSGLLAAQPMRHERGIYGASFSPDEALILTWSQDDRTARLWTTTNGFSAAEIMNHEDLVDNAVFSPDGALILTRTKDTVYLWHTRNGLLAITNPIKHHALHKAIFSPDGRLIVTCSRNNRMARLWHTANGVPATEPMQHDDDFIEGAIFSPDSYRLLTWTMNGKIWLWDTTNGSLTIKKPIECGYPIKDAAFSANGQQMLTRSLDGTARLWNTVDSSPASHLMRHAHWVNGAIFSPDERLILTWSQDRTARLWHAANGEPATPPMEHEKAIRKAVFSADGRLVLSWSEDGIARLWRTTDGSSILPPMKHEEFLYDSILRAGENMILTCSQAGVVRRWHIVNDLATTQVMRHNRSVNNANFSRDESMVLSSDLDATVQLWRPTDGSLIAGPIKHNDDGGIIGSSLSPDEDLILTWGDKVVRLWRTADSLPAAKPMVHNDTVKGAIFNSNSSQILTWSLDGTARLWNTENGELAFGPMQHDYWVEGAGFSPDERLILTWSLDGTARLWYTANGRPVSPIMQHEKGIMGAIFNSDGSRILTWSLDGTARLWNTKNGASVIMQHDGRVEGATFSPDERLILTWSWDWTVRLWDSVDGTPVIPSMKHGHCVKSAVFNRDASLILTRSLDGTARLWRAADGSSAAQIMNHNDWVLGAIFSPDERLILTWSRDGTARLWHTIDGSPAIQPLKHQGSVSRAVFSRDERVILTCSDDGTARLWDIGVDYDFPNGYLPLLVEVTTGTVMDDLGNVTALSPEGWRKRREKYIEIAEKHLETCQYKDANVYLRQKQFWENMK